ncbi:MAG: thrombospondin type 3 repeat-containing protein [Myxococcaceae bacterium]|nr:thrombospondin type 3 repeat-containing protein [Myxococcaceae bacterium]
MAFDDTGRMAGQHQVPMSLPDGGITARGQGCTWSRSGAITDFGSTNSAVRCLNNVGGMVVSEQGGAVTVHPAGDGGTAVMFASGIGLSGRCLNDRGSLIYFENLQAKLSIDGVTTVIPNPETQGLVSCRDLNQRDHALCTHSYSTTVAYVTVWRDGGHQRPPIALRGRVYPIAMNDYGQVLANNNDPFDTRQRFALTAGASPTISLDSALADAGWYLSSAHDLNNSGQVLVMGHKVGYGYRSLILDFSDCRDTNGNGNVDDDGDSLCDSWETTGIDVDLDGRPELLLPGADPQHKDLYVEIDWMELHQPLTAALQAVEAAFANAPVTNPDGTTGINLHLELDEQALAHAPTTAFGAEFQTIKKSWFGTAAQRGSTGAMGAKRLAYRYALFAHQMPGSTSSGMAELPGDDLIVTLGARGRAQHNVGTLDEQAATFMHELGHNLGLRHGGDDDWYCKPNYQSVMSYVLQFEGDPAVGRKLDFSRRKLPDLVEPFLNELLGIQGDPGDIAVWEPPAMRGSLVTSPGNAPIDWNRDNVAATVGLSADITQSCRPGLDTLTGHDDWSNIRYALKPPSGSAAGAPPVEMTYEESLAMSPDTDHDGHTNIQDNCPYVANSPQMDMDADGVGNECDTCPTVFNPGQEPIMGCTPMMPPVDAGVVVDNDAGMVVDIDAGSVTVADAGATLDAGEPEPDGGVLPTEPPPQGCGCGASDGVSCLALALAVLLRRKR